MSEAMDAKPADEAEPLLTGLLRFWASSVGAKVVMALTGIVLWVFMMGHLAGNLLIFVGPEAFNHYGATLQGNPPLLWAVRIGLIDLLPGAHRRAPSAPRCLNRAARPVPYATRATRTPIRPAAQLGALVGPRAALLSSSTTWRTSPGASSGPAPLLANGDVRRLHDGGAGLLGGSRSRGSTSSGSCCSPRTCRTASTALFQHLGLWGPRWTPFAQERWRCVIGYGMCARVRSPFRSPCCSGWCNVKLDAQDPVGADRSRSGRRHKVDLTLVNPANKRKYKVIVVGTGLAGASAAATLSELGYQVELLLLPGLAAPRALHRRAGRHQRGEELPERRRLACWRLVYDTVKGGDFRAREANVYRLAEVSANIIDQCVAQGVPFAREYGGLLVEPLLRRRAGVAHLLRPRADRPAAAARRLRAAGEADSARAA